MPQPYAKLKIQMDSIGEWMLETDESSSGPVSRFYKSIGGMTLGGHLLGGCHHLHLTLMILSSQVYHYILKVDLKQNQITIQIHQCGEHTNIPHETCKSIWFFILFGLPSQPTNFPDFDATSEQPRNYRGFPRL